ncbi:MAG: Swt1 family HEPN domain-containing protein [Gammaproteobacteria bacterium WSBS_2016_MAG_OTU1]
MNEEQDKLRYFFDRCMTVLAKGIEPFVRRLLHEGRGKFSSEKIDARVLLKAINQNWKCFSGTLAMSDHGCVKVLLDFANDKWAHKNKLFDNSDITTSIDHVKRLLDAANTIEATEEKIELEKIEKEFGDFVRSTQPQKPDIVNGAIEINENHTADNISGKKVLCPACEKFYFKTWPLGWDGHALKCSGLSKNSHSERKSEFLHRFGYLIKAHRGKYLRRP